MAVIAKGHLLPTKVKQNGESTWCKYEYPSDSDDDAKSDFHDLINAQFALLQKCSQISHAQTHQAYIASAVIGAFQHSPHRPGVHPSANVEALAVAGAGSTRSGVVGG